VYLHHTDAHTNANEYDDANGDAYPNPDRTTYRHTTSPAPVDRHLPRSYGGAHAESGASAAPPTPLTGQMEES